MGKMKLSVEVKKFVMAFAENKEKLSSYIDDDTLVEMVKSIKCMGKDESIVPDDLSMLTKLKTVSFFFTKMKKAPVLPESVREVDFAYCELEEMPQLPKKCKRVDLTGNPSLELEEIPSF